MIQGKIHQNILLKKLNLQKKTHYTSSSLTDFPDPQLSRCDNHHSKSTNFSYVNLFIIHSKCFSNSDCLQSLSLFFITTWCLPYLEDVSNKSYHRFDCIFAWKCCKLKAYLPGNEAAWAIVN